LPNTAVFHDARFFCHSWESGGGSADDLEGGTTGKHAVSFTRLVRSGKQEDGKKNVMERGPGERGFLIGA